MMSTLAALLPLSPDSAFGFWGSGALSLGLGFLFGFVLEQAGFGNARKLASQFYLHDMTVLKVMFTAIVVAMLLLSLSAGLGIVDMDRVWVPPMYLWSAVLGGFLLGLGFIVGGYCPGTSLVAMVTLKIDGLLFVLGTMIGLTLFGEVAGWPAIAAFWHQAGAYGVVTLPGVLGVSPVLVVFGVAVMAVGVFAMVEQVEPMVGKPVDPAASRRPLAIGAAVVILLAAVGVAVGRPGAEQKLAWMTPQLDEELSSRKFHIDPGELLDMVNNNRLRLALVDVRPEADFNLFHLVDARRVEPDRPLVPWAEKLPEETVKVLMSNDEAAAEAAWKWYRARGIANVYILEGGVNRWLAVYSATAHEGVLAASPLPASVKPDDRLHWEFASAVGSACPAARPDPSHTAKRTYQVKVKSAAGGGKKSGGCG
jgi:rhodanese-related sulfurtransferase